ncbi:UNVERIFIED_CONTAM: hypothetical protein Sradi_3616600 [Sesamum radiatum]|uniref:DUF4283 domain-containing protein n=1 Tax=Sesamum radiatum TaxID=300843 RepID=A0AAW2QHB7_SESRA
MEPDLDQLKKAWKLTKGKEDGTLMPSGLWNSNSGEHNLCLVGRFLSNRPYRFEALCSSIQSMLLPVKGLDITSLQEGRFFLHFNHVINRQRAMDGCPWIFEKNILILNTVGALENPTTEADDSGRSWGATLRIRVGLNVNKPLKRALRIRSTSSEELLV